MKKNSIIIIIAVLLMTLHPIYSFADDGNTVEIPTVINPDPNRDLKPDPNPGSTPDPTDDPDPFPKPNNKGNRIPSRPVIITITDGEGVIIPGVDNEEVISYSIYNEDGMLIAMYDDDMDFASAVFSMTGVIEIRIALDGYSLCGWMEL